MIKRLIKIFLYSIIFLVLLIGYLSTFGIQTTKFNSKIKNEILEFNKEINLDLKTVKILLNIRNLSLEIKTFNPIIVFKNQKLPLDSVKTKISIRAFINNKFSINNLNISTKKIKLDDIILLARSLKNSTELFLLDKIVKNGFVVADINLNFDENGKVKNNYEVNGYVKDGQLNLLKKYNANNIDLIFKIKNNKYSLKNIKTNFNKIKLSFPLLEIKEREKSYLINGKLLNLDSNIKSLNELFQNSLKNHGIEDISFNSENDFSFNINKKLKIENFNLKSIINLDNLIYKKDLPSIKKYLPNLKELIALKDHNIIIEYKKDKFDISGKGKIIIENKTDNLSYELINNNDTYNFNTSINIINNSFLLDSLNYKKSEGQNSKLELNGSYIENKETKFNSILFKDDKKNYFSVKNLILNDNLKIIDVNSLDLNFINRNNIKNEIYLKKNKDIYDISGNSFDASKLINIILNNDDEDSESMFSNLNSDFNIKIDKTYLDKVEFVENLTGKIFFKDNKIQKLNLKSFFPNNKRLTLSIDTNDNNEKITTVFSDYPKPLVKQYKFIKGFEEGVLDFYSIKKNDVSNSLLNIENFKLQEIPILAKLLTLASLQGISDLLTGEGVRFTDFEMKFSNQKQLMTIEEIYAIGPAISILMDGYIESKKLISLRGTLVPASTINRTIASIPLIGNILVGKKTGEGVFGVSFKIKGQPKDLKTTVNPIKTLTPRFITRTLEKIKKN